MDEPSPRTSRQALAAALAAALALAGGGFLLGRVNGPADDPPEPSPDAEVAADPSLSLWSGPLLRQDLVALAASAADTTASGLAPDNALVQSDGRRFEIRLPFGCAGPAATGDASGWTFDPAGGTLRVFVTPEAWTADEWDFGAGEAAVESIEGFWIDRPWTTSEACPRQAAAAAADTAAAADPAALEEDEGEAAAERPTLAIGQVHTADSQRSGRGGGDAYRAVVRVSGDAPDTSQGFRVRLSGRLARAAGPAPVACRQPDLARRPACLVTVVLDELAIENPASGEVLATWTLGRGAADPGG